VSIERKSEGYVRRAKLYSIRDLDGKAARIKDKNIRLMETQSTAADYCSKMGKSSKLKNLLLF
jgi:hypothetical protein